MKLIFSLCYFLFFIVSSIDAINTEQHSISTFKSSATKLEQTVQSLKSNGFSLLASDTLIGLTPNDTFKIAGTYSRTGNIYVVYNGVLIIDNANATVNGNIIAVHNSKILIRNSILNSPQQYTYERQVYVANKATVEISNVTWNCSGYPHGVSVKDSAIVLVNNLTQADFTTWGMDTHASITINGSNRAGEFLVNDYTKLDLKNCTEALIWHDFPDQCNINWSFGVRDTAYAYLFNKNQPGVSGIESEIKIDSTYNIMWGMMISHGANVTINNSKVRTAGLLFYKPLDSVVVSGIQNYSNYTSYQLPLSDRNVVFNNTYVNTWSVYVANKSILYIENCLLGEVVSYHKSKVYANFVTVDCSGGHYEAADSSFAFLYNCNIPCQLWSNHNSLLVLSNCQNVGQAFSIGNSVLVIAQTPTTLEPVALEGSAVWYAHIETPLQLFLNSNNTINGFAFIDKGISSTLMDFSTYELFYQKKGESIWTSINGAPVTNEVRNSLLVNWNTTGLTDGIYTLKLILTSSNGESIEAKTETSLLTVGIDKKKQELFSLYPNPVNDVLIVKFDYEPYEIEVIDIYGQINPVSITTKNVNTSILNISNLSSGVYFIKSGNTVKKILKQ